MKKIIKTAVAAYLAGSVLITTAYNLFPGRAWDIANHRYGLLCAGYQQIEGSHDIYILSPFCNYADVFLFGIGWDAEGWETFSDGFDCFGEYEM